MVKRVAVLGSGSWGTTSSILIANNVANLDGFAKEIRMHVYPEDHEGRSLIEIINEDHENKKYLPSIPMPSVIHASSNAEEVLKDATHIVFVVPSQFIEKTLESVKHFVPKNAVGISLTKGFLEGRKDIELISTLVTEATGIHMSVLSGANIASEISQGKFSETTIGCDNEAIGKEWKSLFHSAHFKVNVVPFVAPLEIIGALKNCVAVAAGIVDGLELGNNTKSAIMRIGFCEIVDICQSYCKVENFKYFLESFGVADLITTCYGGRNRLVSEQFVKTKKSLEQLEADLLNGQKLQGPVSLYHLHNLLKSKGKENDYPLMLVTYKVIHDGLDPMELIKTLERTL